MLGGDPDATGSSLRLVLAHASALTARLLRVLRSSSSGGIGHDFNCRSPTPLQPTIVVDACPFHSSACPINTTRAIYTGGDLFDLERPSR